MIRMLLDLLDQLFYMWNTELATTLFGVSIATGVLALFCRLRTPRRWRE